MELSHQVPFSLKATTSGALQIGSVLRRISCCMDGISSQGSGLLLEDTMHMAVPQTANMNKWSISGYSPPVTTQ